MATELKEQRTLVLKRVPPGDRWVFVDGTNQSTYPSLTDALEAWYQSNGDTQFYMDARKGTIEIIKTEEVEKPVTKYSLYGEN
jgi:hypothetical protein